MRELKGLVAPSILVIPITIAFGAPLLAAEGFCGPDLLSVRRISRLSST